MRRGAGLLATFGRVDVTLEIIDFLHDDVVFEGTLQEARVTKGRT